MFPHRTPVVSRFSRRLRAPGMMLGSALVALPGCGPPSGPAPAARDVVLLISIDTLPTGRVGCYGAPNVRTPEIDRLARTGVQVRDAISPAPLTLPSHATLLTGLNPPRHGVRENGLFRLEDSYATVPELLPAGVRKAAFVGAFPVSSRFHLDQGFDLYDDDFGPRTDRLRPPERPAGAVFAAAADWLSEPESGKRPFVWVHVFDPHYPYRAPRPWPRIGGTLRGGGGYEGEVAYTDRELGRFLRRIGARDRDRRATIVLVADHGESLGAHGEITHSIFIYDATQRVPLILAAPGLAPRLETHLRPLVDVTPTLLAAHGCEPPPPCEGSPLQEPSSAGEAYIETKHPELLRGWSPLHGIRTKDWKYIRAPRSELYDVRNDPGETRNLYGTHPDVETRLEARLDEILARSTAGRPPVVEEQTLEQLGALGYVSTVEPGSTPDLAKDPKDGIVSAAALFHGMQAYLDRDWERAERLLRRAIQLDPEGKEAHSHLAGTYYALGRFALAAEYARRSLELAPHLNEAPVYSTLGQALLAMDRPADAVEPLRTAVRLRPKDEKYERLLREAESRLP